MVEKRGGWEGGNHGDISLSPLAGKRLQRDIEEMAKGLRIFGLGMISTSVRPAPPPQRQLFHSAKVSRKQLESDPAFPPPSKNSAPLLRSPFPLSPLLLSPLMCVWSGSSGGRVGVFKCLNSRRQKEARGIV